MQVSFSFGRRNPHCSNCGDERGGPIGHEISECTYRPERPESLTRWLTWLNIADCPCPYDWRSLGTLYRVSMGNGWVRLSADPACPHHNGAENTPPTSTANRRKS